MIIEALSNIVFWLFGLMFDGFSIVTLPLNLVSVLVDILKYGIWVMGLDLFVITWTCIFGWLFAKLAIGLVLFIWRLLPLT